MSPHWLTAVVILRFIYGKFVAFFFCLFSFIEIKCSMHTIFHTTLHRICTAIWWLNAFYLTLYIIWITRPLKLLITFLLVKSDELLELIGLNFVKVVWILDFMWSNCSSSHLKQCQIHCQQRYTYKHNLWMNLYTKWHRPMKLSQNGNYGLKICCLYLMKFRPSSYRKYLSQKSYSYQEYF